MGTCFGTSPKYDSQCTKLKSEKTCNEQIACEWRSVSDINAWVKSVSSGVKGLALAKPSIPTTVKVSTSTPHASHDHQQMDVSKLDATLSAWKTKYGLPAKAVSALKSLVVTHSIDFKNSHTVISNSETSIWEVAMGGRNYNGQVSLAFVFGQVGASVSKKANSVSCSRHNCLRYAHWQECDCEVDGAYMGGGYGHGCPHGLDRQAAFGWSSHRSLTSAEHAAVQKAMQYALFAKVNAEATLLENALRNGLSDSVWVDNATQPLVVSEMLVDSATHWDINDNATQPLVV